MEDSLLLWSDVLRFHGHECPGLAIGYRVSLIAKSNLKLGVATDDEQIVCVAETDACGVDAIQVILKATLGTGSLRISYKGKNAYSFYNRENGESLRIVFNGFPDEGATRQEKIDILLSAGSENLFTIKQVTEPCPQKASKFKSYPCISCKESVAENAIIESNNQKYCIDCAKKHVKISR